MRGETGLGQLRAWWSERQGLNTDYRPQAPAETLRSAGWARSVGGSAPYLSLHARSAASRAEIDACVERREIHELPSARGCTYVLPAEDYALGLTVAALAGDGDMKTALTLGVTAAEVDALCSAVVDALSDGEAAPEEIRERVGGKARSLGEEGKKKGLTTTAAAGAGAAPGGRRDPPCAGERRARSTTLWLCALDAESAARVRVEALSRPTRSWPSATGPGSARQAWPSSNGSPD